MPPVVTLDDLTAMMAADENHRYEISPEGVVSTMPPPGYAHAIIATRLMVWLTQGSSWSRSCRPAPRASTR